MFKGLFTEIRKLNIFGRDLQLEKDSTNRFNSVQSFVLSWIVFIAINILHYI